MSQYSGRGTAVRLFCLPWLFALVNKPLSLMLSRIFVCEGKSGDYQKYLKQCTSIELRCSTHVSEVLQVRWASSQL